ncbi:MAG: arylamine N-acetyltransferase, partial [Bifidobacteriaceae bacterium]|nr:arylamine N-acetyltransferase [Bifidobacteriaceae bacterium]
MTTARSAMADSTGGRPAPAKRIPVGPLTFVRVPVARRPAAVSQRDWDVLSGVNDYIIDHVSYDHARARGRSADDVLQSPEVTLRRGLGVCMDYAALFERLARHHGYTVRSMRSDRLNHAWNEVQLAGRWWIVDVTWNDGEMFTSGQPLPAIVHNDPDFRKKYFLTTARDEAALRRQGLIQSTHQVDDARPVDYQRTLQAMAILDRLQPLVERRNQVIRKQTGLIDRSNALVDEHNRLVDELNAQATARQPEPREERLDKLQQRLADLDARIAERQTLIDKLRVEMDSLYGQYQRLAQEFPLAVWYEITT